MIVGILIGREGSVGFPGKNICPVLGEPLMTYPLKAAYPIVDEMVVSTDSDEIKEIAKRYKCRIIDRPQELCTETARAEDVFIHAYEYIKSIPYISMQLEYLVLLMCNAPMITSKMIEEGIKVLRENPEYDSAVSVSRYNMFSPLRARRISDDGLLHPFVAHQYIPGELDSNRDTQGDCWFADMGVSIVRPKCLENIEEGILPQKWMGQKIYPLKQECGFDVDYEWEIPLVENWLKKHGIH